MFSFECRCHLVYRKDLVTCLCQFYTYPKFPATEGEHMLGLPACSGVGGGASPPEASILNIVTLYNLQNVSSPLNNKPLTFVARFQDPAI